jgi:hypothetical protein
MTDANETVDTFPESLDISQPATLMDLFRAGADLSADDLTSLRCSLEYETIAAALGVTREEIEQLDLRIQEQG